MPKPITPQEAKLIQVIRAVPFGKVEIHMVDGQPDRVEIIRESVKLT